MPGKLSKFQALSWPERRVLLQAMLLLPLFWVGLRALGLSRLHAWVARWPVTARLPRPDVKPAAIGTLVGIAGNNVPFPSTCLTQSLLLTWLLGRRGVRSELRIGVRRVDGGIDSHAWVEHEGRPVNDTPEVAERFAAFDRSLSPEQGSPP